MKSYKIYWRKHDPKDPPSISIKSSLTVDETLLFQTINILLDNGYEVKEIIKNPSE